MFRNLLPSLQRRHAPGTVPERSGRAYEDEFFGHLDEFFRFPFGGALGRTPFPAVDVTEDENEVVVSAELPGLEPKDVELSLEHGNLVIKGEKRYELKDKDGKHRWSERGYGSFHRVVPLPEGVQEEGVRAGYKNGVLTVRLSLDESRKPRRIAIQG